MDWDTATIRRTMERVSKVLQEFPETRDDDRLLIVKLWGSDMDEQELSDHQEFLKMFAKGNLEFPDTITRCRRRLQQKYPTLRGDKYEARHKIEAAVCEQLTLW